MPLGRAFYVMCAVGLHLSRATDYSFKYFRYATETNGMQLPSNRLILLEGNYFMSLFQMLKRLFLCSVKR